MTPSPPEGWQWDESLYLGSAPYYLRGRPPYAPELAETLRRILPLDGQGRLLDVGCGPGVVTLPLAQCFTAGRTRSRSGDAGGRCAPRGRCGHREHHLGAGSGRGPAGGTRQVPRGDLCPVL